MPSAPFLAKGCEYVPNEPQTDMTSQLIRCPKCDQPLTQVGQFWVCPQHGQVSLDNPVAALRIFRSYGHDSNEWLVTQIKADLEKRGHDVWFDKSEINAGDDWWRAITDGIMGSHRVVSFLSKHSTREPGVCRDEIAIFIGVRGGNIQTILVESEAEVQRPANFSRKTPGQIHGRPALDRATRQTRPMSAQSTLSVQKTYRKVTI